MTVKKKPSEAITILNAAYKKLTKALEAVNRDGDLPYYQLSNDFRDLAEELWPVIFEEIVNLTIFTEGEGQREIPQEWIDLQETKGA